MRSVGSLSPTSRSVHNDKVDRALAALSGRPSSYTYVLLNQAHFYLDIAAALVIGLVTGLLVHQSLAGAALMVALACATTPLLDRRIVGIDSEGLVQAKSAPFSNRPIELLPPLRFSEIEVVGNRGHGGAVFRINGTTYVGSRGSAALAGALQSRRT